MRENVFQIDSRDGVTVGGKTLELFGHCTIDDDYFGAAILLDISPFTGELNDFLPLVEEGEEDGSFNEHESDSWEWSDIWDHFDMDGQLEEVPATMTFEQLNQLYIDREGTPLPPVQQEFPLGESKLVNLLEADGLEEIDDQ